MSTSSVEHVSEVTSDLLHELSRRLDSLWRYDQYIANCDGQIELRDYWRTIKLQETRTVEVLKSLLQQRAKNGDF